MLRLQFTTQSVLNVQMMQPVSQSEYYLAVILTTVECRAFERMEGKEMNKKRN